MEKRIITKKNRAKSSTLLKELRTNYTKWGEIVQSNVSSEFCFVCFECFDIYTNVDEFKYHVSEHINQINDEDKSGTTIIKMEIEKNVPFTELVELAECDESNPDNGETDDVESSSYYVISEMDDETSENRSEDNNFTIGCHCCPDLKFACKGVLKEHLSKKSDIPVYACDQCPGVYMSRYELKAHQLVHIANSTIQCVYCSTIFSNENELKNHLNANINRNRKQSPLISHELISSDESNLDTELSIVQEESDDEYEPNLEEVVLEEVSETESNDIVSPEYDEYQCDICSKSYTRLKSLKLHLEKCHQANADSVANPNPTYKCSLCQNNYVKKKNYIEHVLSHKKSVGIVFTCTICTKDCLSFVNLKKHLADDHGTTPIANENPLKCPSCPKRYRQEHSLKQHLFKSHNVPEAYNFECKICKKSFKCKENLVQHKRIHSGEKPYECKICKKRFNHSSYINIHMRTHTKEKPFQCSICDTTYISQSKLTAHMKAHNGIRPHLCKSCDRTFRTPADLRDHFRSEHTDERPFECKICGRGFAKQKLLLQHHFLHTDIKKFQCRFCPMAFSQSAGRHGHEKRIHPQIK